MPTTALPGLSAPSVFGPRNIASFPFAAVAISIASHTGTSSASTRSASRRSAGTPSWPSAPASTPCVTPASRWCMRYKTTTQGTQLPDRWALPGRAARRHRRDLRLRLPRPRLVRRRGRRATPPTGCAASSWLALESLRARMLDHGDDRPAVLDEVERRIADAAPAARAGAATRSTGASCSASCRWATPSSPRSSARAGPNTQINAACASTTQAVALAEDWIRAGRCRRVVVVSADDATSRHAAAAGSARASWPPERPRPTTSVEDAATPVRPTPSRHDHRHGRRGARGRVRRCRPRARPAADLRGARLDHRQLRVPRHAPRRGPHRRRHGGRRRAGRGAAASTAHDIAGETVFVSHETYTPARGGSAAAEINALRASSATDADRIVITNTKGFTGHPMGVGIEDVARRQGARDRHRAAGAELPGARSRPGRAQPLAAAGRTRSGTRSGWRPGSARRSPCRCCGGRRLPTAAPRAERARLRLPDRRPRRLAALAATA